MYIINLLALIISILSQIANIVASNVGDYVIEFNDSNIESTLEQASYSLIYFYRDDCKFCSEFNPVFEYLSTLYNDGNGKQQVDLQIVKTNGKINSRLNSLFKIDRYPTLKLLNYDTKGIIKYGEKNRELETIMEFLKKETQVSPNYGAIESNIIYLDDTNFEDHVKNMEKDTVVVFILSYLQDWETYYYPNHFYQVLSGSELYNNLNFAIVDVSQFNASKITSDYHIGDYPTLMYLSKTDGFKIYKSKLQIQLSGNILHEDDISTFISQAYSESEDYGRWYNGTDVLLKSIEGDVYDNTKHVRKYGFNFRQQNVKDEESDLNEEYRSLLMALEL